MIRINRIWKFYIIYTALFILLVTLAGFVLQVQLKKKLKHQLEQQVLTLAKVLATVLPDTADSTIVIPWCREYQEATEARITLIDKEGKVIGDSSDEFIIDESRLDRPEIHGAIAEGMATAIRYSETLRADMFYVAVFFKEKEIIIRLALPMTEVKTIENEVMIFFALALYLTPILAIVTSFLFTRYVASEGSDLTRDSSHKHRMD